MTFNTLWGACILGEVVDGIVELSAEGRIVEQVVQNTPKVRPYVRIDTCVVMPDHVHLLLVLLPHDVVTARQQISDRPIGPERRSLGAIIGQIKSISAKQINDVRNSPAVAVWQRNYFERVVRDDELERVRRYIMTNPSRWDRDSLWPPR